MPWVFAGSSFLAAALLFQLEPFIGKSMLPHYGGTPAVWSTCVFFFQLLLLLGYLYAHLLHRSLPVGRQLAVHAAVTGAALLALPIRFDVAGLSGGVRHPVAGLLWDLVTSIGLVFFVVSTTAPLLQAWYAAARPQGNPYVLYVASNAGSLAGLLAYPTIVEFWLPLSSQSMVFTGAFVGLAVLFAVCGIMALRGRPVTTVADEVAASGSDPSVTFQTRWNWFVWSLCPCSLMLGVTTYLSAEVAPMPAIWMLPLSLYLLSFVIAFAQPPRWVIPVSTAGFALLAVLVAVSRYQSEHATVTGLLLHNGLLFCGAIALHSRLAAARPATRHLTEFYLWVSCAGLCGSIFNTLIAPLVFNWFAEYPLAIGLGLFLTPWPRLASRSRRRMSFGVRLAIVCLVLVGASWDIYFSEMSRRVIYRERTFFGEFHIVSKNKGVAHELMHGTTVHGVQVVLKEGRLRRPPLTYYFNTGPIGQLIRACRGTPVVRSVGIVGLGIGSLSAYAEIDDDYTFYEIDPAIDRIARDTRYFTYLRDTPERGAKVSVILGDARLRLREAADHAYGLLVLDAFTSDSIPVHLLTKEALKEYFSKLRPGGLLAFHISNNYLNLEAVLGNIAADMGHVSYVQYDDRLSEEEHRLGKFASVWLVVAASTTALEPVLDSGLWRPCRLLPDVGVWTDDQSNVLSVIRWKR